MLAARVERAMTTMKVRVSNASRAVSKLFFASPFSLSSTQHSEIESSTDGNLFRALGRKLNHWGKQKTASDCDSLVARADIMRHTGKQETMRKAAKAKIYNAAIADTEQADYVLTLRASRATKFIAVNTKTKRADHVLTYHGAGFEANRHAPLISCELSSETEVDGASVMPASLQTAHHEDTTVYGADAAGLGMGQAIYGLFAELPSSTVSHAGLDRASITESVHADGQFETARTATMSFWLPPITVDGALYIRMVHELPEQPAADEPVHIT